MSRSVGRCHDRQQGMPTLVGCRRSIGAGARAGPVTVTARYGRASGGGHDRGGIRSGGPRPGPQPGHGGFPRGWGPRDLGPTPPVAALDSDSTGLHPAHQQAGRKPEPNLNPGGAPAVWQSRRPPVGWPRGPRPAFCRFAGAAAVDAEAGNARLSAILPLQGWNWRLQEIPAAGRSAAGRVAGGAGAIAAASFFGLFDWGFKGQNALKSGQSPVAASERAASVCRIGGAG